MPTATPRVVWRPRLLGLLLLLLLPDGLGGLSVVGNPGEPAARGGGEAAESALPSA